MGETAEKRAGRWAWLPGHMPRVAALIAERRAADGEDWVAHCWAMGVVRAEPGWWWCAEGPLAVGVPADAGVVEMWCRARVGRPDAAVLVLRPRPEGWSRG